MTESCPRTRTHAPVSQLWSNVRVRACLMWEESDSIRTTVRFARATYSLNDNELHQVILLNIFLPHSILGWMA